MKVLFNPKSEYPDGVVIHLDVKSLENDRSNLLYCYGIDSGYRIQRPDPKLFKHRIYFEQEEPNGFVNGQLPHERGNWELSYWTKVLHPCPYTAAWENYVYNTDIFELANFFHNVKYTYESEKIYDVCYIGSTAYDKGYSIFRQMTDVISKFPKYKFISRDPLPTVTDRSVSYIDKMKINSQCKISVVANLLHQCNSYERQYIANNIKRMPDWHLNEAFSMIDHGILPQIKGRVMEAGVGKSLVLVLRDEWNVIEHFYTPDVHFIYFDSIDKLEDKIKECLANWDYCEKIINNMFDYIMKNYTMDAFYKRHLQEYDI